MAIVIVWTAAVKRRRFAHVARNVNVARDVNVAKIVNVEQDVIVARTCRTNGESASDMQENHVKEG